MTKTWPAYVFGFKIPTGPYKPNWKTYYIGHGLKVVRFQKKNYNDWYLILKVYKNGKLVHEKVYSNWYFTLKQFKPLLIKKYA